MVDDRQIRHDAGNEVLASLLDGQLSDHKRAEQIYALMSGDSSLRAEYEEQREVKALLSQVVEFREPEFMSTRVLAGIKARQELRRGSFMRNLRLAGGGVVLFALGVGTTLQFYPLPQGEAQPASLMASPNFPAPGLFEATDAQFDTLPVSFESEVPEDIDPLLRQFLEQGLDAHNYRQMMVTNGAVSPDMSKAVMVLDNGSN
jgi:hypothetical protein